MSKSEADGFLPVHFDAWVGQEFHNTGGFTALVILVAIGNLSVTPLRSTYFHVIGDDIEWAGISELLAGSGTAWDGVLFATLSNEVEGGPVEDMVARYELQELAQRLEEDRLTLNKNHFFDRWGRRLQIEEATAQ